MSRGTENVPLYLAYVIEGLVPALGNVLIMVCILWHSALRSRNSYLMLVGQSLADTAILLGYCFGGIYRLFLVISDTHSDSIPVQTCMLFIQNLLWLSAGNWQGCMLVLVSLDRLWSVTFPLQYIGFPKSYAYSTITFTFLINLVAGSTIISTNYNRNLTVPAPCFASHVYGALGPVSHFYYYDAEQVLAAISILIYIFVWVAYKKGHSQVGTGTVQEDQYQIRQQRRLTASLAVSCLCTFFLFLFPFRVAQWLARKNYRALSLTFYVISQLNPLANCIIYPIRHLELRQSFWAIIRGQAMPLDLRMWNSNAQARYLNNRARNTDNRAPIEVNVVEL